MHGPNLDHRNYSLRNVLIDPSPPFIGVSLMRCRGAEHVGPSSGTDTTCGRDGNCGLSKAKYSRAVSKLQLILHSTLSPSCYFVVKGKTGRNHSYLLLSLKNSRRSSLRKVRKLDSPRIVSFHFIDISPIVDTPSF